MGDAESLARDHVGKLALDLVARGETDRVHDDVQVAPAGFELLEDRIDLLVLGDVERHHQLRSGLRGDLVDPGFQFLVLIRECQFGALAVHGLGNAPRDRARTGDADDQRAFTLQDSHCRFLCMQASSRSAMVVARSGMAPRAGVEPATCRLGGGCSIL